MGVVWGYKTYVARTHMTKKAVATRPFITLCALVLSALSFANPVQAQTYKVQKLDSSGYISEETVYNNLEDHDLSLRYAKQQIQKGEMLNAGAALERMLYANPNWHSARLLYAAVLYRLDDQKAALRELSLLEGKELNDYQTETYTRYKTAFATPPKPSLLNLARTHDGDDDPVSTITAIGAYQPEDPIKASLIVSFRADNNAGNALTDEGFGFNNRGDISAVVGARFQANLPISKDGSVTARLAANGLTRRHETFDQADYDVIDLQVGIGKKQGRGRLSADIDARHINISGENYLNQIGPRVTYSQAVSDTTRATVSVSAYEQDYKPLSIAVLEDSRDGIKTSFQFGILKKIKQNQKVTAVVGFESKSADLDAFAYSGPVAALGYEKEFQNSVTFKTQARARLLKYKGNLLPAFSDREDTRISGRASVGVPLKMFTKTDAVKGVQIELGANYNYRGSNTPGSDYENLGADLRLTVDF